MIFSVSEKGAPSKFDDIHLIIRHNPNIPKLVYIGKCRIYSQKVMQVVKMTESKKNIEEPFGLFYQFDDDEFSELRKFYGLKISMESLKDIHELIEHIDKLLEFKMEM